MKKKTKGEEREREREEEDKRHSKRVYTRIHRVDVCWATEPAPKQNKWKHHPKRKKKTKRDGGRIVKKKKEKTFVTKGAKYLRLDKNYFPLTLNNN